MKKNTLALLLGTLCILPLTGCASGPSAIIEFNLTQMNGLPIEDIQVNVKKNGKVVASLITDNDGFTAKRMPLGDYDLSFANVPEGWVPDTTKIKKGDISVDVSFTTSIIKEEVESGHTYKVGQVLHDFEVTVADPTGKPFRQMASEYLKGHEVLAINLWATWCGWCEKEMPFMDEYYRENNDKVEIVALSSDRKDTLQDAVDWRNKFNLSFPMGIDEINVSNDTYKKSITYCWNPKGIPATMVIDRYGIIQKMHEGALLSKGEFVRLFDPYLGDDYTPKKLYK